MQKISEKTFVLVLQSENRNVDYLGLTKRINPYMCHYLSNQENSKYVYDYKFINMSLFSEPEPSCDEIPLQEGEMYKMLLDSKINDSFKNQIIHPATSKIFLIHYLLNSLEHKKYDFIVYLDSDAWIQTPDYLNTLIDYLKNNEAKNGTYSRDPFMQRNTFINSGAFIIKNNNYISNMYSAMIERMKMDDSHLKKWQFDQYYISNFVFENKNDFLIFVPNVLNTPCGIIFRHNWYKTHKLYRDLYELLEISYVSGFRPPEKNFDIEKYIDNNPYPNTETYAYEWNEM